MVHMTISKKINFLILSLLLIVSASIIVTNSFFYQRDMKRQLLEDRLPFAHR